MHKETVRLVPGVETAVLYIHGICGTPDHFRKLIVLEELIPKHVSVYNLPLERQKKSWQEIRLLILFDFEQWISETHD